MNSLPSEKEDIVSGDQAEEALEYALEWDDPSDEILDEGHSRHEFQNSLSHKKPINFHSTGPQSKEERKKRDGLRDSDEEDP